MENREREPFLSSDDEELWTWEDERDELRERIEKLEAERLKLREKTQSQYNYIANLQDANAVLRKELLRLKVLVGDVKEKLKVIE